MVKDCSASDVEITTGKNNMLIGGLVGYAGSITKDKTTVLENCVTKNVSIKAGENSSRIGGILGGGFYLKSFAKQVPEPAAFSSGVKFANNPGEALKVADIEDRKSVV